MPDSEFFEGERDDEPSEIEFPAKDYLDLFESSLGLKFVEGSHSFAGDRLVVRWRSCGGMDCEQGGAFES